MAALDGMRVLDMTQYEAGTSCTQALAWLGAEIVKIEPPENGDPGRNVGLGKDGGYSAYFCNWNANKRSVALNLRSDEGHDLFLKMLPGFDVFVENYGPGVVDRLNIGYEALKAVHPTLIYAQLKGFGTYGPKAGYKSFDMVAQAAAGSFSVTGEADGRPLLPGPTTGDSGTGVQLGMAILAAFIQRERTGEGQSIEISMQEAMTYFMRTRIATASAWGTKAAGRNGNGAGLPPIELYPCTPFGPNDWIYVMPITGGQWDVFCTAIDRPDLTVDERFAAPQDRVAHADVLYEIVAEWTRARTKFEAMEQLAGAGVPCSAVQDTAELHNDPHLIERGFVHNLDLPHHGKVPLLGFAPQMSESSVDLDAPPLLGQHTDEVLAAELGLDDSALTQLRESGVIR